VARDLLSVDKIPIPLILKRRVMSALAIALLSALYNFARKRGLSFIGRW
jgi:hypothetical protein